MFQVNGPIIVQILVQEVEMPLQPPGLLLLNFLPLLGQWKQKQSWALFLGRWKDVSESDPSFLTHYFGLTIRPRFVDL